MAKPKSPSRKPDAALPSAFQEARDELFQHIMNCGVIGADEAHQKDWFDDTMKYFAERYPELNDRESSELRTLGERFAQPPKARASA